MSITMIGTTESYRSNKSLMDRPTKVYSAIIRAFFYAVMVYPLRDWLCYSVNFYKMSITFIKGLLLSCRPFAVFFAIISIIVYPVYLECFVIAFFHVTKKCFKRISPFTTNTNATPTIPMIVDMRRIIAPLFHVSPANVYFTTRQTVSFEVYAWEFFSIAATAFCFSVKKVIGPSVQFITAIADTRHYPATILLAIKASNKQFSESLSYEIRQFFSSRFIIHIGIVSNLLKVASRKSIFSKEIE